MTTDENGEPPAEAAVVVGVDGSAAARAALRWAHEEAGRLGAPLLAVTVAPGRRAAPDRAEQEAGTILDRDLAEVLGQEDVDVHRLVVRGRPVPALLEASRGAWLVVLGSPEVHRARDPWSGAVAALLPRQAECPVVLVPASGCGRRA